MGCGSTKEIIVLELKGPSSSPSSLAERHEIGEYNASIILILKNYPPKNIPTNLIYTLVTLKSLSENIII